MTASRRVVAAAAVAASLAGLAALIVGTAGPDDPLSAAASAPVRAPPPPADPTAGAVPEAARVWTERADEVTRACDLPVESSCEGPTCVALLHGPDLDHGLGWLDLAARSPRFVASTLLRDVGVDAGSLPCGAAIDALVASAGVPMLELPDGTELWCATDATGDTALCDRAAAERYGVDGFGAPGVRRLSFR